MSFQQLPKEQSQKFIKQCQISQSFQSNKQIPGKVYVRFVGTPLYFPVYRCSQESLVSIRSTISERQQTAFLKLIQTFSIDRGLCSNQNINQLSLFLGKISLSHFSFRQSDNNHPDNHKNFSSIINPFLAQKFQRNINKPTSPIIPLPVILSLVEILIVSPHSKHFLQSI